MRSKKRAKALQGFGRTRRDASESTQLDWLRDSTAKSDSKRKDTEKDISTSTPENKAAAVGQASSERWVAAAVFPRLALELLGGRPPPGSTTPSWQDTVLVLDDRDVHEQQNAPFSVRNMTRFIDASNDLLEQHILPGQRVMDAQKISPSVQIVVVESQQLDEHLLFLAELCLQLTPIVEPGTSASFTRGALLLEFSGLPGALRVHVAALFQQLTTAGHEVYIGCAHGPRRALALAKSLAQNTPKKGLVKERMRIAEHMELELMPLEVLGLSVDKSEELASLGIRSARDLLRLSPKGLAARLQKEAKATLDLLQGHDDAPLVGIAPPLEVLEKVELDFPVSDEEPLLFLARPLLERIAQRLAAQQKKLSTLQVQFRLQRPQQTFVESHFALHFPSPLQQATEMWRAFAAKLSSSGIPVPQNEEDAHRTQQQNVAEQILKPEELPEGLRPEVVALRFLVMQDAAIVPHQQDAFSEGKLPPQILIGLLAEWVAELGEENVGCLTRVPHALPEQMSHLSWNASLISPADNKNAGSCSDGSDGSLQKLCDDGHFRSSWPWPLHFFKSPLPLASLKASIAHIAPFALLEGEDTSFKPYRRDYAVLTTADGRRALGAFDDELQQWCIHGFFD